MAHFYTNIIRNNARDAVVNWNGNNTAGFLVTGGQVQSITGGGATEQSLVTGWRTEIQGSTTTKHYTDKIPTKIKTVIYGNASTASTTIQFCSGGTAGAVEDIATFTGSGRVDYDPPLETSYNCTRPDISITESGNANQSLYIVLIPPSEFS
jgi:hypothetical protein